METVARNTQIRNISTAITNGEKLIVVSGPISSGKTVTIRKVLKELECIERRAHIFCETGDVLPVILTQLLESLTGIKQKPKFVNSIPKFIQLCRSNCPDRTIVVLDSFDLLDKMAVDLFAKIEAVCDSDLLPNFTFIIVTHVNPQFLGCEPMKHYHVLFPAYTNTEIIEVVCAALKTSDSDPVSTLVHICLPVTRDVRDIIYVAYTLGNDLQDAANLGKRALGILEAMRSQQVSRINDLARTATSLLIALYIASRTSIASDVFKFSRMRQKPKKKPKFLENHEYVSMERVIAIAKALIYSHMEGFDTDFSVYLQVKHLVTLGLVEIRGDLNADPRLKCLATDQEVSALANAYDVRLEDYLCE